MRLCHVKIWRNDKIQGMEKIESSQIQDDCFRYLNVDWKSIFINLFKNILFLPAKIEKVTDKETLGRLFNPVLFGPFNPISPAYLSVSKDPPYVFRVWLGLGLPIILEITCQGMIYNIQRGSWCLDDQNPPAPLPLENDGLL